MCLDFCLFILYRNALQLFTTDEIMPRPLPQDQEWRNDTPFQGEDGVKALETLEKRINQHVRLKNTILDLF